MIETITKYFHNLNELQLKQFEALGILYPDWNSKINVISRKDIDNLWVNHLLHSLAIAKFITPVAETRFIDLGCGGGFPGIPLAIMWPDCQFHLVDRIGKKILVAQSIASDIGLENVTFKHGDASECKREYDFVVSRAVMRLDELVKISRRLVNRGGRNGYPNGLICLKGGNMSEESQGLDKKQEIQEYDLSLYFDEPFFETKKLIYTPF
ncbi:MAG: 16S rRNA (guanine(527)-N(7))-methyltransferase RsmG [Clostridiales bacterium]|nr:16S rRNA (guanine(527)-N(7))-methyltransferase RsmG [Clostridiales bacterium]